MKPILILLFSVTLFASCQKDIDETQNIAAATYLNVAYGTDPQQKMDVYLPAGRSRDSTKVLVLIHGGGWNTGDKADFAEYLSILKQRLPDFALININYRLATGSNLFPVPEMDVQAAVSFIIGKGDEYLFNPNRLSFLGVSAGGHLALLQAYKYPSSRVKAVVDFFGPTDMADMYNNPRNPLVPIAVAAVMGGTPAAKPLLYQQSSPINYVSTQSPPTLILHGGDDPLVDPSQSLSLRAKLTLVGVVSQMAFYPTEGHGWTGAKLDDSFNKIESFLKAHVR
jgi:acetyl esterase/lipase